MNRITVTLTAVALLSICCTDGNKTILLKFKHQPGTHTVYETIFKGNSRIYEKDSLVVNRANEITITSTSTVLRVVNDSIAEVSTAYHYRYHHINNLDSTVTDTVSDGESLILYIMPSGKVIDSKLSLQDSLFDIGDPQQFAEYTMVEFPLIELEQGKSWIQGRVAVIDGITLEATTRFTVESFARENGYDCVSISYEGSMLLPFRSEPSESIQRSGIHRLSVTGVLYFAYREGLIISQRERRVISGEGRKWQLGQEENFLDYRVGIEYDISMQLKQPPKHTG